MEKVVRIVRKDQDDRNIKYWRSLTYSERMRNLEEMRQQVIKRKYLVIGGFAVNYHGYPRYTKDVDFWLWMTEPNMAKLIEAIKEENGSKIELGPFSCF